MKLFLKIISGIICTLYLIVVIIVTTCLLCYNEYNITEIFDRSLIIIDEDLNDYQKGDLLSVPKTTEEDLKVDEQILFYEIVDNQVAVNLGTITNIDKTSAKDTIYTINNNHDIYFESIIGKEDEAKNYDNLGTILGFLESQFGFLILIVLPTLLLFLYEIYRFIIELKTPLEDK